MEAAISIFVILVIFLLLVLTAAVKVVREYERGVVFRLGRLVGPRGPGLILLLPYIEKMTKVDLRTVTMDVPAQEVITKDNVTVRVNAVVYFRVLDPNAAVVNVADYIRATSQISQTTLRSILGQSSLDELLSEREQINQQLQQIIDDQTEPWGIKVSVVEVKDVELPQSMQRAMARQAEAEREKRAKIIHAEGEFQASQQLAEAAEVIERNPVTIQLRYLQTLTEIGVEKNTTIVFPLPIELMGAMLGSLNGTNAPTPAPAPTNPAPRPAPSASAPPRPVATAPAASTGAADRGSSSPATQSQTQSQGPAQAAQSRPVEPPTPR